VRDPGVDISAEEDSLAENVHRAALHPLDQFRAFQASRQKGQSEEEIAAAFFVGVNVVKQRLRLATVSEKLLDVYADDGMSLEQLMAFTVTDDHVRQEQIWEALQRSYSQEPYQIRRMLTERTAPCPLASTPMSRPAASSCAISFSRTTADGWDNVGLLDGLVAEKLKAEAEKIAAEGWKWTEVNVDFPFGPTHQLRELEGTPTDLTAEEQATIEALKTEYAKLEAEYENSDELPDARLLSSDGRWFSCTIRHVGGPLWITHAAERVLSEMSGSPIISESGTAIGVVCTVTAPREGGPNARLSRQPP
jgi:ParB family chromosome partitioning protein